MTGTATNGAVAPDDGSGIPADLLADDPPAVAEPTAEEAAARKAEAEKQELHGRLRAQEDMIRGLNGKLTELGENVKAIGDRTKATDDRSRDAADRGWQWAVDDAWRAIDVATENADKEMLRKAKSDLATLMRNQPAPQPASDTKGATDTKQQTAQIDPDIAPWMAVNPWYNTDAETRGLADGIYFNLVVNEPGLSTKERLTKMKERVIKLLPDKFPTQARPAAQTVSRPGPQSAAPKAKKTKTVADLPEDAKLALARIKRRDPSFTDDDYVKHYKWD